MAQKIISVLNSIVLALTTVLLPRLSNFIGNNQQENFKLLGNKALSFVLAISLPVCTGLITLSRPMVMVLFGEKYEASIFVLVIWTPILTIIGLSQVYGKSILYSTGHEKLMTVCTFIGMIVYLVVAIPGVMYYSIIGASVGSFCAELAVTGCMIFFGRRCHPCTLFQKKNILYVMACIVMALPIEVCTHLFDNYILQLCVGIPLGAFSYMAILGLMEDTFYYEVLYIVKKYARIRRN